LEPDWSVRCTIRSPLRYRGRLYDRLSQTIEGAGFCSVTHFITSVLRDLASSGEIKGNDRLTEEEVGVIRERLRRLGYL